METRTWNDAKVWTGSRHQRCRACGQMINKGEWTKQHIPSGHIYHDDEAEELGAYCG